MPTLGYPLDLTGAAPTNLVVNETHTFTTPPTRVFVPAGGPFYSTTMQIRNNATNALLQPNSDYKLLHLHREGTIASGKQVCAVVYVLNLDITAIRIQYQCIGDNYADTSDTIRDLLSGTPPVEPSIAWGHVFGVPIQFAPAEHLHHADEVYGMQEVVSAIEQLRVAVLTGDSFAFDALYHYIATLFSSYSWVTQQELNNAISAATVNPYGTLRTYRTFAELRAETQFPNDASIIYVAAGRGNHLDGQGRSFVWAKNSAAFDNDETVLRPDIIAVGANGRLQSAMRIELDVRNLARTLGRRIGTYGAIESDLSAVSPLGSANLDTVVTPNVYWVSSATTNRPPNVDSGYLVVERAHINNVVQTLHALSTTVALPDDDITRTDAVIHHRSGTRSVETDAMTWTPWESMFSRTRAIVNGIDTELALTRTTTADLNGLARSAMFWIESTAPNNPFPGNPCVLDVQCLSDVVTVQHAITVEYEAYRRGTGGVDYNGHTWSGWIYRANRNGDINQVFNVNSLPLVDILPNHAVNAGFLATQMATLWSRLTVAGVDADLATTNSVHGADLDAILNPCEVYYTPSTGNRPSPYGLLKVWRESWNIVYQLAHSSDNNLHYRYGSFYSGIWHWSAWSRSATVVEMTSAIAAATAGVTPYEYMSVNPGVGSVTTVYHYVATGARFLAIAISAPGGGGGAGGWAAGGEGGGGGAGGFGQLVVEGNLDGFFVVTTQYGDNASGPLGGQGMDSWGTAAYNNPSSVATVYTAGGTAVLQMTVTAGQTGGTADSQWNGDGVSNGGGAGASGSASVWRNPGYSRRAIVHTFMSDTANVQATAGGYNANGALGQGGTIATGARNGDGGNPNNDGHGGQGGLHQAGSGALGSTGGYGAVRVVWH